MLYPKTFIPLGVLIAVCSHTHAQNSGIIDVSDLKNYSNQEIPSYITKDNTPANNPITDEGATLGRVLFYDKRLSIDNTVSCASCHQQEHAFSDLAERSTGINGNLTPRHSMRLVNIRFGADPKVRWDETADSIEEQMIIPIKKEEEMGYSGENGNPDFDDLIAELNATDYYPALFDMVFGDPQITEERMGLAMAQFVRSIQSFDSKYDIGRAQVNSDSEDFPNFTADENAGKRLFIDDFEWVEDEIEVDAVGGEPAAILPAARRISGGLNCATCHTPPEFDIDPASLNNGFVRASPPGPGAPLDLNVFRSPTMRDMVKGDGETLNGGMFHAGLATNLNLIFAHYDFRRIEEDNPSMDPRMTRTNSQGEEIGQWLDVTVQERQQMNAFLATLTGSNVYTDEKWSDPFDESGSLTVINTVEITSFTYDSDTNTVRIEWASQPGATYTLWTSAELSEDNWTIVEEGIPASTNSFEVIYDPFSPTNPLKSFYRVSEESP